MTYISRYVNAYISLDFYKKECIIDTTRTYKSCCIIENNILVHSEEFGYLEELFEDLITNHRVDTFYFAGGINFNNFCYNVLTQIIEKYTNVRRIFVIDNYNDLSRKWMVDEFLRFYYDVAYLPNKYNYKCKRSYYKYYAMIDNSDFVILYANINPKNDSYKTYKYAKENNFLFNKEISDFPQIIIGYKKTLEI